MNWYSDSGECLDFSAERRFRIDALNRLWVEPIPGHAGAPPFTLGGDGGGAHKSLDKAQDYAEVFMERHPVHDMPYSQPVRRPRVTENPTETTQQSQWSLVKLKEEDIVGVLPTEKDMEGGDGTTNKTPQEFERFDLSMDISARLRDHLDANRSLVDVGFKATADGITKLREVFENCGVLEYFPEDFAPIDVGARNPETEGPGGPTGFVEFPTLVLDIGPDSGNWSILNEVGVSSMGRPGAKMNPKYVGDRTRFDDIRFALYLAIEGKFTINRYKKKKSVHEGH